MRSYCIYCKTGSEVKLVYLLKKDMLDLMGMEVNLMFPVRILNEKRKGQWVKMEQSLFPGYIFLYLGDDEVFPSYIVKQERDVFKILRYPDGSMALRGADEQYANWVRNHNGRLEPSKVAFREGQVVKIISGPLLDLQGRIVKMDRHHKRVLVAFMFAGQERMINLSVDIIDLPPQ